MVYVSILEIVEISYGYIFNIQFRNGFGEFSRKYKYEKESDTINLINAKNEICIDGINETETFGKYAEEIIREYFNNGKF